MPGFKDLLRKKEKIESAEISTVTPQAIPEPKLPQASEFTFVRTDTHTQEVIHPPYYDGDDSEPANSPVEAASGVRTPPTTPERKRGLGRFRKSSSAIAPATSPEIHPEREKRRLSQRLHITSKSRSTSTSSVNLPSDLPTIEDAYNESGDQELKEAKWEERATMLATKAPGNSPASPTAAVAPPTSGLADLNLSAGGSKSRSSSRSRSVSDAQGDANIQEAIRLHEAGGPENLEAATKMFGQLAEQGNVLSQVLYGLSLRHGWGIAANPTLAVQYLSAAASNSASVESEALKAGMKKGGAAKGELVLAIFELANCFRHGWGVNVDKKAAREYYETAANLGDTDAMNEAAWCYLEGFGGKKDKVSNFPFIICYLLLPGTSVPGLILELLCPSSLRFADTSIRIGSTRPVPEATPAEKPCRAALSRLSSTLHGPTHHLVLGSMSRFPPPLRETIPCQQPISERRIPIFGPHASPWAAMQQSPTNHTYSCSLGSCISSKVFYHPMEC
jgi:TPR repeat protein